MKKRTFNSPTLEELERQQLVSRARWPLFQIIIALSFLLGLLLATFILRAVSDTAAQLDLARSLLLAVSAGSFLSMVTTMLGEASRRAAKERWDMLYRLECLRIIEGTRKTDQQERVAPQTDGSDEQVDQKTEETIRAERLEAEQRMAKLLGTLSLFGVHLGRKRGLPN